MQFGVFTLFDFFPEWQNEPDYYRDTLNLMVYAEELGFDSVWVGEEHFYSFGICPSPQLFLTAVARETTRLRLGTAISVLSVEHPLRKAEDFAMLDILSGGRLIFGVGRGVYPKHFEGFQVSPEQNRARAEEALEIIQRAWTQQTIAYDGEFWQIPELSVSPKPVQRPHPPIYRSAHSLETYTVAGVKGHGLLVAPWLAHDRVLKEGLAAYRTALRTHHQTPPPIAATQFIFVDTDQERALAEAQETIGRFVRMVASAMPPEIIAALPPTDAIRMAYERLVSMIDHVPERAIIGTPEDCRRRLAAIHAETGIEHILLYLHAGARDLTRARRGLELFAREVMPVLQ